LALNQNISTLQKMANNEKWRALYDLAAQARELAPWTWMYESQVTGIKVPASPLTWYLSIMGSNEEHLCYCFYKDMPGLEGLAMMRSQDFDTAEMEDEETQATMLYGMMSSVRSQSAFHVSFEQDEILPDEQKEWLQKMGIKPSKAGLHTALTDYTPGMFPWIIREEDIELVTQLLQAAIIITKEVQKEGEAGFPDWDFEEDMRIYTATFGADGQVQLSTEVQTVDLTEEYLESKLDPMRYPAEWEKISKLKAGKQVLAMGRLFMNNTVRESEEHRPSSPDPMVIVDTRNTRYGTYQLPRFGKSRIRYAQLVPRIWQKTSENPDCR
jgi:hypothetical protein